MSYQNPPNWTPVTDSTPQQTIHAAHHNNVQQWITEAITAISASLVVVDSVTAVDRPNATTVLWLKNSDNAVDGDLRVIDL